MTGPSKLVDSFLQEQSDTPIGHTMLERVITAGSGFLNAATESEP